MKLAASMLVVSFAVLLGACQGPEQCKDYTAGNGGTIDFGKCGDDKPRAIQCDGFVRGALATPGVPAKCTCSLGGAAGAQFEMTVVDPLMTQDGAIKVANEKCGWHLSK
jgi:hypothetical protein